MTTNKTDRSFKTLINRRTTDQDKNYYEEFSDRTINIHASEVWADTIDPDPVVAVAAGIAVEEYLELTEDLTVPNQHAWNDGGLKNWISDKYGSNYGIHLLDDDDNEIFPTDDSGWFFDYQTGILTFDGDNSSHLKPYQITGYRYIGSFSEAQHSYYKFPFELPEGTGTGGFPTERAIEADVISIPPRATTKIPFKAKKPYKNISVFINGVLIPLAAGMLPFDQESETRDITSDKTILFHLSADGKIHSREIEILTKWDVEYTPFTSVARTYIVVAGNPNDVTITIKSMAGMPKASFGSALTGQLILNPGGQNEETVTYTANNVQINHYNLNDRQDYDFTITLDTPMASKHFADEPVVFIPYIIPSTVIQIGYGPIPVSMAFHQADKSLYIGSLGDGLLRLDQTGEWIQIPYDTVGLRDGVWEGPHPDDLISIIGLFTVKTQVLFGYEGGSRIVCICDNSIISPGAPKNDGVYSMDILSRSRYDSTGLPLTLTDIGGTDYYRWDTRPTAISRSSGFEVEVGRPFMIGFNDGMYAGHLPNGTEWAAGEFGDPAVGRTTWVDVSGNLPAGNARKIHSIATTPDYPNLVVIGTEDGLYITIDMDIITGYTAGQSAPVIWNKLTPPHGIIDSPCYMVHFDAFSNYVFNEKYLSFDNTLPTLTFWHAFALTAQVTLAPDFLTNPIYAFGYTLKLEILDDGNVVQHTDILSFTDEEVYLSKLIEKINEDTTKFDAYNSLAQAGLSVEPRLVIRIAYDYFDNHVPVLGNDEIYDYKIKLTFTGSSVVIYNGTGNIGTSLVKSDVGTQIVQDIFSMGAFDPSIAMKYADFIGADTFALSIANHPAGLYLVKNFADMIEYTELEYTGCTMFWRNDGDTLDPAWNLYVVNPLTNALPIKVIAEIETGAISMGVEELSPLTGDETHSFYVEIVVGGP